MNTAQKPHTGWGRTKFAGGRTPALAIAIPVDILIAAAASLIGLASGVIPDKIALLGTAVLALCLSAPCIALVYALVVDRSTLRDATERPEESVETRWLDQASEGAFRDTILITGLALTGIALAGLRFDAMWALMGVLVVALLSCGIRYLIAKRQG